MPPTGYAGLNAKEIALAKANPWQATQYYVSSQVAINETKNRFGKNGYQDVSDAFRNADWNANLTARIGSSSDAKKWTDAHESESSGIDKQMDLHNNSVGLSLGSKYDFRGLSTNAAGLLNRQLSNEVYSAIKSGKGKIIKNGKLVSSAF